MAKKPTTQPSFEGGMLTQAKALAALNAAALAATNALPDALRKCSDREAMRRTIDDRDTCQLAYTSALARSLRHTGPLFEQTADELAEAAKAVAKKARQLETAAEAASLFADLVRLSSKLALAFA